MNDFINSPYVSQPSGFYRIAFGFLFVIALATIWISDAAAKQTAQKPVAKQKAKTPNKSSAKNQTKTPLAPAFDAAKDWQILMDEALGLRNALALAPDDTQARQELAALALRAVRAAERALSRGDEDSFIAYREQVQLQFAGTRPAIGKMSDRGISVADYALGTMALHGILDEQSVERACAHFATALQRGFGGAKFRYAQCIEDSDPPRALALLNEAADSGHIAAIERLGRICLEADPPDAACAFTRFEKAAEEGRASAKVLLGWMHAEGIGGKIDLARSVAYYRDAAKQGEPSAYNNLGEMYERGRGVTKDEGKAFANYRAAAEAGFPPGQFNLGRLYAAGRGTAPDHTEARRWLIEAEKAGIPPARQILDLLDQDAGQSDPK